MNYDKYIDENNTLTDEAFQLSNDDFRKLVAYLTGKISASIRLHNVSTADVLLDRNVDRSLVKTNVCIRVPTNLLQEIREFAGRLNVPASDFIAYVLKYGFRSYREIMEI